MNNREMDLMFERFQYGPDVDTMDDAHQAQYDYEGEVPENEDRADWQKIKLKGCVRVG